MKGGSWTVLPPLSLMPIIPQQTLLLGVYTVTDTLDLRFLHLLPSLNLLRVLDPGDPWNNKNRDKRLQFWPLG